MIFIRVNPTTKKPFLYGFKLCKQGRTYPHNKLQRGRFLLVCINNCSFLVKRLLDLQLTFRGFSKRHFLLCSVSENKSISI